MSRAIIIIGLLLVLTASAGCSFVFHALDASASMWMPALTDSISHMGDVKPEQAKNLEEKAK